jgi:hypothetical protein
VNAPAVTEGRLGLYPGREIPNIESRPTVDLARLLQGRAAEYAGQLLPALYSLCGGAHALAALMALEAARGQNLQAGLQQRRTLDRLSLREHLRRMALDWPRQLGHRGLESAGASALRGSPALSERSGSAALLNWLSDVLLDADARDWLAAWQAADDVWLNRWLANSDGFTTLLLEDCAAQARSLLLRGDPALQAPENLESPALSLPASEGAHETGCWARHGQRPARQALDRMLARIAECIHLSLALDEGAYLDAAGLQLGQGHAAGWCQMARGLLVHELQLDDSGSSIARYRVLAPTEWNFHPAGVAARTLAAVPDDEAERACGIIAAALDPCVEYRVIHAATAGGAHA